MNKLIFGKNGIERITSCEIVNNEVHLFIESTNGDVSTLVRPNFSWMLAANQLDSEFTKLDGSLYYNWIKTYSTREEFLEDRRNYYKRDTYSIYDAKEASMVLNGFTLFKGAKVDEVSVLGFDIESTGLIHDDKSKVLLIANTFRRNGKITRKMFCYDEYHTEKQMFDAWSDWVREMNPSVLLGHNVYGFDFKYMDFCAVKAGTSLKLGRDGSSITFNDYSSKFRKDGSQFYTYNKVNCFGREIIDTMYLAIKYDIGRKYSSYRLKTIIAEEGLEIEGRQFYDAGNIRNTYKDPIEWEKIKRYAENDGDDAVALYDKFIPSFFYMTQTVPKSFTEMGLSASGSQINSVLVRSYLQDFHSIPKTTDATDHVAGGISFAIPGIYKNVLKIDLKSAYPSQILRFKLHDTYKDPKANFYNLVVHFANERFKLKALAKTDSYYKGLDGAAKQFLNSMYGVCNTKGLNFNSQALAAKITKETRDVLKDSMVWATSKDFEYWHKLFKEKTGDAEEEIDANSES